MPLPQKVCPFVLRLVNDEADVLGFRHPTAGHQWVKGSITQGEAPLDAAKRELVEESGLVTDGPMMSLGMVNIDDPRGIWHLFAASSVGLPDNWVHHTADDYGHSFQFFWHPLGTTLDHRWHAQFHAPFRVLQSALIDGKWPDTDVRLTLA
jgi:8-oxo-dGTP pyrophosphatase MutT (NUDIX family)